MGSKLERGATALVLCAGVALSNGAAAQSQVTEADYARAEKMLSMTTAPLVDHAIQGVKWLDDGHFVYVDNDANGTRLMRMGVAASMSISIISGGRLWGLIACHHREPRLVPPSVRAAADMFSLFVSMRVSAAEQAVVSQQEEGAREVREMLALRITGQKDSATALAGALELLERTLPCDGVALRSDGQWTMHAPPL